MRTTPPKSAPPILSSQADAAAQDLYSVRDFVRYAITRFNEAGVVFGHGTQDAVDEAAFIVLEGLKLPIDDLTPYLDARLTAQERRMMADLIHTRISTRLPAPYLLGRAYLKGYGFYIDERALIPRSFIADILCNDAGFSQLDDYGAVTSVLDLCTGSGCLAIIAADLFPNAHVDAVDLSPDALEVARRNVSDYGLEERVTLYCGDLFAPLSGKTYDLIITNPPYVDADGMGTLPPEFRHEPVMALAAGEDGLDLVHAIIKGAKSHLAPHGGLLCELGRCGPAFSAAYPALPVRWIDTDTSSGEVFWATRDILP